jgi:distribution and morphology protein 10
LLYNPLIGFLSTAYSAQISPAVALSSRFGVNVYSYESDLSIGGEWWIGRRRGTRSLNTKVQANQGDAIEKSLGREESGEEELRRSRLAMLAESSLRDVEVEVQKAETVDWPKPRWRPTDARTSLRQAEVSGSSPVAATGPSGDDERDGVLKARLSGNWVRRQAPTYPSPGADALQSIALLYEARIRDCLVSFGVISDLLSRQRPIRSIGVEVQYFS